MKQLHRKDYRIDLTFRSPKRWIFKTIHMRFAYKQASFRQILQMSREIIDEKKSLRLWLFEFLSKNQFKTDRIKVKPKDINSLSDQKVTEIVQIIMNSYGNRYFTVEESKKKGRAFSKNPDSSLVALILEQTNETVETLLEMTWEQIEFLIDGMIWNMNSKTKEGQKRNKSKNIMDAERAFMSDEKALERMKNLEKRLQKGNVNFKKKYGRKI